jgi:hypothetical protein
MLLVVLLLLLRSVTLPLPSNPPLPLLFLGEVTEEEVVVVAARSDASEAAAPGGMSECVACVTRPLFVRPRLGGPPDVGL